MDLTTLEMTKVANIAITNPRSTSATYQKLTMMTIDDNGNFYVVNYGSTTYAYLYTFKLDQVVEGQITDLAPIVNESAGNIGFYGYYGSLAYDHDNDVIYMAASSSSTGTSSSYLVKLDPVTGKGEKVNTTYAGGYTATTYGSRLYNTIYGLYIVPSKTSIVKPAPTVSSFSISKTEAKCLPGSVFTLTYEILPWNLTDKTVTWTTSDASVATVEDGQGDCCWCWHRDHYRYHQRCAQPHRYLRNDGGEARHHPAHRSDLGSRRQCLLVRIHHR